MIVNCEFSYDKVYRCWIRNQEIPKSENVFIFQGEHQHKQTNHDVNDLHFLSCEMPRLPQSIGYTFKNIEELRVSHSNLKSLTKFDLKKFENLKRIFMSDNDIEFLPGDLFEFTRNIEWIHFRENKTKFIGPKIFDGLEHLKYIDLNGNFNIDCCYEAACHGGVSLEILNERIRIHCKPPLDERQMLKKYGRDPNEHGTKIQQKLMRKLSHNFQNELKDFLELDDFKDFTIKVADREFKVHKFLFAVRSQTFAEHIKNNPEADNLELLDIPVEIFEYILSFVYDDELPETRNIHEVFAAAGKLKMKGLIELTAGILRSRMESETNLKTLYEIMSLAKKFEHEELKLKAFGEIRKHFPGRNLADELADQSDQLKTFIDAESALEQI